MQVLLVNGTYATIKSLEVEHLETLEITYNFEVEDYHTYYVGSEGILVHNTCGVDLVDNAIKTGNVKDYVIVDNYDDALAIAKQKGGVSGSPISSTPNNYGGNDLAFIRTTKAGGKINVNILEHMTGRPARGMSTHLNVNYGIDGKNWHIFF